MPYLIDGNNLLGSWGGPRGPGDRRGEVVQRVAELCRRRGMRATIVFDGGPLRADRSAQELGPIVIKVPPPGGDADSVIRDIIEHAPHPAEWTVVTSDKPLYSYVRTRGAAAMQVRDWTALERETRAAGVTKRPGGTAEKPERENDVAGWLARFGAGKADPSDQA